MWFEIIPPFLIVTAGVGLPGVSLYWIHYLALGNNPKSIFGNTVSFVKRLVEINIALDRELNKNMWYEILPSFFIITAALGLPGWGLYHIHNLSLGNHFRRSLLEPWDRHMYLRDVRLTGDAYKVNGLNELPDEKASK